MNVATSLRARVLLEEARRLGIDLADLLAAAPAIERSTVAAFTASIEPTFTPATAATYRPYWRLVIALHGDRPIDQLTPIDLHAAVEAAAARAIAARPRSTGRASRETCVAALRALYRRAVDAGVVTVNPAAALTKPRRTRSGRRALSDREVVELIDAVRTTSHDPDLDLLLIRFHLETGARRGGALALQAGDLAPDRATVWLHEKGDTEREQPVSPSLVAALAHHAATRGPVRAAAPVFRTAAGTAISARRYDTLFGRARPLLDWATRTPVSAHVLRHTAITAIGRIGGYPVAQAFAGHAPPTITGRYLHASLTEIAHTVALMTGEPHPLADQPDTPCGRR